MSKKNNTVLPDHERLAFKVIETPHQRGSLYDPVRQEILRVLTEGYEDYASEVRREQRTLDDGTRITEEVKVERPVRRYWMTVPEILDTLRTTNPSLSLATTKAYYHLGKLHEQGLLEQFPEIASGTKTRVRGRHFRTPARFFVEITVEASVGYSGSAVMPEEIGPRFIELAEGVRQSGVAASLEYQVNLDGILLWVSMTMSRHPDGLNIIAVVRDITTHRTLEERLEKSEVEFGKLVEKSFQGYAIFQDEIPVFVNPAYANTVGRTQSELNLMTPDEAWKMIHPEDRAILEERNRKMSRGAEELSRQRFRYVRPDGTIRWVESFGRKTEHLGRPALLTLEIDITERIEAELELQKSEQRNRVIVEAMSDLVLVYDSEGRYSEYFAQDDSLLIRPWNEMKRRKLEEIVPQDLADQHEMYVKQVRETGESITYEAELEMDGTLRWYQRTMMLHEDGESIVVASKDISERKAAENSVKRSEKRFREIFNTSPVAIGRCNLEGAFMELNQAFLNLFGISSTDDGAGYRLKNDPHMPKWALDQVAEGDLVTFDVTYDFDRALECELYNTANTGKADLIVTLVPLNLPESDPEAGYLTMIQDVTERRRAEEALRDSEERYRAFFEQAGDSILISDPLTSEILDFNRQAHESLGYTEEEFRKLKLWEIDDVEDKTEVEARLMKITENGSLVFETKHKAKRGTIRDVRVSARMLSFHNRMINQAIITDITEEKKAEERLRDAYELAQTYLDVAGVMIVALDADGEVVLMNQKGLGLLEYEKSEVIGENWFQIVVPEEDKQRNLEVFKQLMDGEVEPVEYFENRIIKKSGELRLIAWHNQVLRDKEGNIIGLLSSGEDITDRKQMELELRESEERFRTLVEEGSHGYLVFQGNPPRIVYSNPAIQRILRYSEEGTQTMSYEGVLDLLMEDEREAAQNRYFAALEFGEDPESDYEFKIIGGDGNEVWIMTSPRLITLNNVPAYQVLVVDITERMQNQEELERSEERYRLLYENLSDGLIITDKEGNITMASSQAAHLFDMTPEDIVGTHILTYIHPDQKDEIADTFRKSLETQEAVPGGIEIHGLKRDGSEFYYHVTNTVLIENGESIGYQSLLRDITERKRMGDALKESEQKYRMLVEHIPEVAWTSDSMGHTLFISPNVEGVYGYTPEEIYEKGEELWFGRIHPDDMERVKQEYSELIENNIGFDTEYRIQRKDGEWIWLHDRTLGTYESEGTVCASGVFSDITEQKQILDDLRISEERYRSLFNSTIDAIFLVKNGKVVEANPSAIKIFGCELEDIIGKTPWSLSPRRQPDGSLSKGSALEKIERVLKGEPQLFYWRHRRCDGTEFDAFIGLNAAKFGDEELIQAVFRPEISDYFHLPE
ncbi:MAG: PAS domain S-box protein [Candidatus Thorarchaeota archaeon]